MHRRQQLQRMIQSIGNESIIDFFRTAHEGFKPCDELLTHYLDDSKEQFSNLKKVGEIEFDEIQRLIVVSIKSNQEFTTFSGKKRQYVLAKKILKTELYDAGIFIYYDESGNFRFSLILAQYAGNKRTFSNFRRYTYYVSPKLANKTFLTQILKADFSNLDKIRAAFSIEAVSNDFYNEFNPHFEQLASVVQGAEVESALKKDFALLFTIRIIFLGFVQKKGWLGGNSEFIQSFWHEYKKHYYGKNNFYTQWISPLFFEALNSPPGRKVKYRNNDFSQETEAILQQAPYLNGELFKEKIGVDNLGLSIPDKEIGEFLEFLFQHNFTIEENTLYDEELELNPEFLGIIFERITNKEAGAVYTQRTEVDYMCRMALVKWLQKNCSCDVRDLYHLFFREGGIGMEFDEDQKQGDFTAKEIRELIVFLQKVTVCDPAAGSGAFEVGMLHVINGILGNLLHRPNTPNDIPQKSIFERKQEIIANSLYGVEVKRWAVWINQLRLWLTLFIDMPDDYKNSFEPLLPSLNFKVRCGDSLVQRIGSKMLPVHDHVQDFSQNLKTKITKLKNLKVDFFHNRATNEEGVRQAENRLFREILDEEIQQKKDLVRKKESLLGHADTQLELMKNLDKTEQLKFSMSPEKIAQINTEIEELESQKRILADDHPLVWNIEFAEIFFERQGFDIIIGNPPYVRQEEIADPYGNLTPKEYKAALQEMVRMDFPKHFTAKMKIDGKSDLYTYFYVRSLNLLNPKGVHVFICSNAWLDVGYGAWLQYFLLKNVPIHSIIDNHAKRSFANADVNTIISIFGAPSKKNVPAQSLAKFVAFKRPFEEVLLSDNLLKIEHAREITREEEIRIYVATVEKLIEEGSDFESVEDEKLGIGKYIGDKWGGKYLRAPDIFFTILEKGKDKFMELKHICSIRRGVTTGCNEFFFLDKQVASKFKIEKEYLRAAILKTEEAKKINLCEYISSGYFFWCNKKKSELKNTNALKYIEWGEEQKIIIKQGRNKGKIISGFQNIETVKNRNLWYDIAKRKPSPVLWIIAHNDRSVAFINNDLIAGDNFFELNPSNYNSDILALILSSTFICLIRELYGRANFGGGVLKTQKPDLSKFFIISERFLNFSRENFDQFLNRESKSIFEESGINPKSETPISQQEPNPLPDRAELDKIVFDALDLTEEERKEVYRAVCQLVWNRISKAKSV